MKRFSTFIILALSLGFLATGQAKADCAFELDAGANMAFSMQEMSAAKSCSEITVTLKNTGTLPANAMGHNWVLSKADDLQPVAIDGQSAGIDNDYVKPGDERVIAYTSIIGGDETTSVTFSVADLEVGGSYMFFCTFPGHWAIMQGKFTVT